MIVRLFLTPLFAVGLVLLGARPAGVSAQDAPGDSAPIPRAPTKSRSVPPTGEVG